MNSMKYSKQQCRNLAPHGFVYGGYWDKLYHFIKGNSRMGFFDTACNQSDIDNGNLVYMAEHGLTRVK